MARTKARPSAPRGARAREGLRPHRRLGTTSPIRRGPGPRPAPVHRRAKSDEPVGSEINTSQNATRARQSRPVAPHSKRARTAPRPVNTHDWVRSSGRTLAATQGGTGRVNNSPCSASACAARATSRNVHALRRDQWTRVIGHVLAAAHSQQLSGALGVWTTRRAPLAWSWHAHSPRGRTSETSPHCAATGEHARIIGHDLA